jgi:hypothetical protein
VDLALAVGVLGGDIHTVEGIKGCRKADRSIGRTWQGGKAELGDMLGKKVLCFLSLCILAMSSRYQKAVPLPVRG